MNISKNLSAACSILFLGGIFFTRFANAQIVGPTFVTREYLGETLELGIPPGYCELDPLMAELVAEKNRGVPLEHGTEVLVFLSCDDLSNMEKRKVPLRRFGFVSFSALQTKLLADSRDTWLPSLGRAIGATTQADIDKQVAPLRKKLDKDPSGSETVAARPRGLLKQDSNAVYFAANMTVSSDGILTDWYSMHAITSVRGVRVEISFQDRMYGSASDREVEALNRAEAWVLAEIAVNETFKGCCQALVRSDSSRSPEKILYSASSYRELGMRKLAQ